MSNIEKLRELEKRATGGPWADFTKAFNDGCVEHKRKTKRNWHSGKRGNQNSGDMALHLIAQDSHYGEPIQPGDIPVQCDWWDLKKVAAIRWSEVQGSMAGAGVFIEEKDRAVIVAARNALPALLAVAEAAKAYRNAVESTNRFEPEEKALDDALAALEAVKL